MTATGWVRYGPTPGAVPANGPGGDDRLRPELADLGRLARRGLRADRESRRRLFDLYRGRLAVDTSGLEGVLARTEGVTASFLEELLRWSRPRARGTPSWPCRPTTCGRRWTSSSPPATP